MPLEKPYYGLERTNTQEKQKNKHSKCYFKAPPMKNTQKWSISENSKLCWKNPSQDGGTETTKSTQNKGLQKSDQKSQ